MKPNEIAQILLVEDDDDHAEILTRSLADHEDRQIFHRVADGESALDYLFRRGQWTDPGASPTPNLILLDLRLPRLDGIEVLRAIKASQSHRHIPVIILTTSGADRDMISAYDNCANSYLIKPADFNALREMMSVLDSYWLDWNRGPARLRPN